MIADDTQDDIATLLQWEYEIRIDRPHLYRVRLYEGRHAGMRRLAMPAVQCTTLRAALLTARIRIAKQVREKHNQRIGRTE